MTFTIVVLPPQSEKSLSWASRLALDVPEASVVTPSNDADAQDALRQAEAAFGVLPAHLLKYADHLRWLQVPLAGPPPGFYYPELVDHPVLVTNMRGTYADRVAMHTVTLLLALARDLPRYAAHQHNHAWLPNNDPASCLYLPEAEVLIVGVGTVGAEVARLLAPFGPRVVATDARLSESPPGVHELYSADRLDELLPTADAVLVTVPHTPTTDRLFARSRFDLMKPSGFLINVGRGPVVDVDDLAAALLQRRVARAALDVFPEEPLPSDHPLWDIPDVIITPHVAAVGPYGDERRYDLLVENARRFAHDEPLINIVNKEEWY